MSTQLWQSEDGLIRVIADAQRSGEIGEYSDLEKTFRADTWIVVFQTDSGSWHISRSRRHPKPSLKRLAHYCELDSVLYISAEDTHGFVVGDPVEVAQAVYAAWQQAAAIELQARIDEMVQRNQFDRDDPPVAFIPAWLRPGLGIYRERRALLREVLAEIAAED